VRDEIGRWYANGKNVVAIRSDPADLNYRNALDQTGGYPHPRV
jgi:hypothetical protein